MNQLEELFNEKLGNHSMPPPTNGWERVGANLSKKNKTIVWIRWAAALIIGMLVIGVIATRQSTTPVEIVSQKNTTPQVGQPEQKEAVASVSTPEKKEVKKAVKKRKPEQNKTEQEATVAPVADANATQVAQMAQTEIVTSTPEGVAVAPTKESKIASRSMVITYTLDPVVAVVPETATADAEQKSSSLGKVVKFARDVKNGDSPIGLKVVKEDLFAHSKKKSPTKTH